ncbi:MAG: type II secretion system protein GspG [Nitrospirae bacterium]|nr:MAG: type II secretion system protein GspG [Nitrospirota bacterium]
MKYTTTQRHRSTEHGFTLIELLVVMVIIGLLAALVGPNIFKNVGRGRQSTAKAQIEMMGQALDSYRLDTGKYPTTSEGLNALNTNSGAQGWDGPYLKKGLPNDPWGKPYQYQSPGTHGDYDLSSYGLDGSPGGDGENKDINSWE